MLASKDEAKGGMYARRFDSFTALSLSDLHVFLVLWKSFLVGVFNLLLVCFVYCWRV